MFSKIDIKAILRVLADWGKVLLILADEAIVFVVVLLILHALGIRIPLPVMIVLVILVGILVLILHFALIPSFHVKKVTGREGMLGEEGIVVEPLTPLGTVNIRGEYWKAQSVEDNIALDENVEIIGLEGLTLKVKRKNH